MKTYEVLEKALALIEREENWAQGDYRIGDALCAEGACLVASGVKLEHDGQRYTFFDDSAEYRNALGALQEVVQHSVHTFNDSHSHPEVIALFQEAIREEKRKEGIPLDIPEPVEVAA